MITAIIPAKNEEKTVRYLVERVSQFVDEIVVVIQQSDILTLGALESAPCSIVIENRNGKGHALRAGAKSARGEVLLFIDADLSHDPNDIPKLTSPIINGDAKHVVGSRMLGGSSELFYTIPQFIRLCGSHVITMAMNHKYKSKLTDSQNGFRAISHNLFVRLDLKEAHTTIEQEMTSQTLRLGEGIIEIPTHEYERRHGKSKINVFKDSWRYVWVIFRILISPKPKGWSSENSDQIQEKYGTRWFDEDF
jgi:dolichol-phosphate mannosyltransferase